MTTDRDCLRAAALACAVRGWRVFPLRPGAKTPAVRDWELRATTDTERIARCWDADAYNIGVACGPSDLVVIDLDTPKHGDHPPPDYGPGITDGADTLAAVAEHHGQQLTLDTHIVRTGRGGTHLYYGAPPSGRVAALGNTAGKLGWLIDTRASGGYVVAAGSIVNGQRYDTVHDVRPAPLPRWLTALLTEPNPPPTGAADALTATLVNRAAGYAGTALRGEVQRVLDATEGSRNHTLNAAAFALGQLTAGGLLPEHLAYNCLTAAARRVGLPTKEADATIRSGLSSGARRPRRAAA